MTPIEILFFTGYAGGAVALAYLVFARGNTGSWMAAALLGAGFAGFTAVTAWSEGPLGFFATPDSSLWDIQVWYDLIFSVGIAIFLILPRARAVGMKPLPWILLTGLVASVALLPMIARMLYLEQASGKVPAKTP